MPNDLEFPGRVFVGGCVDDREDYQNCVNCRAWSLKLLQNEKKNQFNVFELYQLSDDNNDLTASAQYERSIKREES